MIITRSPMRITLGGGGTDLPSFYSQHVGFLITMAINKYFYSVVSPRQDNKIQVISSDFKSMETKAIERMNEITMEIPKVVMRHFDIDRGCNIFTGSEIPSGTGLGSSGSVMVNMIKAMSVFNGLDLSKREIAETACYLEMDVMGAPVGKQDQYIASYGGVKNFIFQKDGTVEVSDARISESTLRELEKNMLVFYTGIRRDSANVLTEQKKASPKTTEQMTFIKDLGLRSRDALESGELSTFAELMREHWEHKKKRSPDMTNSLINEWYDHALKNGAVGGKVIGAGGGGFLLFYTLDREKLVRELASTGLTPVRFDFDFEGSTLLVNTA